MRGKVQMLSDGEFAIMKCVWTEEKAPTQTQIMKWVNENCGKSLKVATIATYIRRIMWKGYLEKVDIGDGHPTYRALISQDEYFNRSSAEFREQWGNSFMKRFVGAFLSEMGQKEKMDFIKEIEKQDGENNE